MHARASARPISLCTCFAIAALALTVTATAGCSSRDIPSQDYRKVEIRDYEGKKLSSISDARENSIKGPQQVDIANYRLKIGGLVKTPIEMTYSEVTSMPPTKKVVELNCVEGWSVTYLWKGVLLADLLEKAGGADPSGKVVIFRCVDGYSSSLPLDYVINRNIILGYEMNEVTMPPERGYPFQVVAEDRWGYKWAKWVTEIEVSSDPNYLGYWEKRGYENDAVLPGKN
jgi:DMSO/TMAO reductase YedYZ molybdopterin-dependent catalytic subunit